MLLLETIVLFSWLVAFAMFRLSVYYMFKALEAMVYDDMLLVNKYNKLGHICNVIGTVFSFGLFSYPYPTFDTIDKVQITTGEVIDDSIHEFLISTLADLTDEQFTTIVDEARRKRNTNRLGRAADV